jgi:hypothetical protein
MHKEAKTYVRHLQNKEIATEKWLVVRHDETYLVTIIQPPYAWRQIVMIQRAKTERMRDETRKKGKQRPDDDDLTQMMRETKQSQ